MEFKQILARPHKFCFQNTRSDELSDELWRKLIARSIRASSQKHSNMKPLLLILIFASACLAQDPVKQLSEITDDVEKRLSTLKVSDDLKQQCTADIAEARANIKLKNLYLSLYTIRTCQLELASLAYAEAKSDLTKKGADVFETEWRELGSSLSEREKILADRSTKLPAVIVALADVSQSQARPYYQSGKLFALNSNMAEGLYYLGRAPANLDFAIMCRGLQLSRPKKATTVFRSPHPELTQLEAMALRTYKSADVSTQQAQYNRVNSNLKIAGELDRASMFEGALLKYLESKFYFGLIITTAEREDLQHLRERTKEMEKQLNTDKVDNSIGLLFWQLADRSLNPDGKVEPSAAQIKRAVVILNQVLPGYFDYLKETRQ